MREAGRQKTESSITRVPRSASDSTAASLLPSFQPPAKGWAPTKARSNAAPAANTVNRRGHMRHLLPWSVRPTGEPPVLREGVIAEKDWHGPDEDRGSSRGR